MQGPWREYKAFRDSEGDSFGDPLPNSYEKTQYKYWLPWYIWAIMAFLAMALMAGTK